MPQEDFSKKCFVIMPISNQDGYEDDHFTKIYDQIFSPAIKKADLEPYRVDENILSEDILTNILKAIQNCPIALCDLSSRNPNVLYELGLRQAYDKPVVLVQDDKTERIFDVAGINTIAYKSERLYENVISAVETIKNALIATMEAKESNTMIKALQLSSAVVKNSDDLSPNDIVQHSLNKVNNRLDHIEDLILSKTHSINERGNEKLVQNQVRQISIICDRYRTMDKYDINADKNIVSILRNCYKELMDIRNLMVYNQISYSKPLLTQIENDIKFIDSTLLG